MNGSWRLKVIKLGNVEIKSLDFGVGDCTLTFEGPLLLPGTKIIDYLSSYENYEKYQSSSPKIEVDDHWVEVNLDDPSKTESVNITVSGFGANEIVNITITTVDSNVIARLQVHTDSNGRGTVLFKPDQNTYTGRCLIEARSPSGLAVLNITDRYHQMIRILLTTSVEV